MALEWLFLILEFFIDYLPKRKMNEDSLRNLATKCTLQLYHDFKDTLDIPVYLNLCLWSLPRSAQPNDCSYSHEYANIKQPIKSVDTRNASRTSDLRWLVPQGYETFPWVSVSSVGRDIHVTRFTDFLGHFLAISRARSSLRPQANSLWLERIK